MIVFRRPVTYHVDNSEAAPRKYKDFSCLVDMACELGLEGLRDHVRSQEAADPDMKRYPRFKKHDDIAAIAIHF